jgi:hypothetical protein
MGKIVDEVANSISLAYQASIKSKNKEEAEGYRQARGMLTNLHAEVGLEPEDLLSPIALQNKFNQFLKSQGVKQKLGGKQSKESMNRIQGSVTTPPKAPPAAAPSAPSEKDKKVARLKEIIADPKETPKRKQEAEAILKTWEGK